MSPASRIRCIDDLLHRVDRQAGVVTLFSGGLDSAHLLYVLAKGGFTDVTALVIDLGEDSDHDLARTVGTRLGAHVEVIAGRDRFVDGFVLPSIPAQAVYLDAHPISASLSRPLLAQVAFEWATEHRAQAILHTANRSQNTLRRLNNSLALLGFPGAFGSPYAEEAMPREIKRDQLAAAGVVEIMDRAYSGDSNIWCREFESGTLDDPEEIGVPEELFRWSASRAGAEPERVTIHFRHGRPIALDGDELTPVQLIERLNAIAGRHGLGRYAGLEQIEDGNKVLEVREMPAAAVLLDAYRRVESATIDAETIREKMHVEQLWVREAVEGRWFGRLRRAAQSFIDLVAQEVTGSVTFELSWRTVTLCGIQAPVPLYIRDREAWERKTLL